MWTGLEEHAGGRFTPERVPASDRAPVWTAETAVALQTQAVQNVEHGVVLVNERENVAQVNPAAARIVDMAPGPCAASEFQSRLEALLLRCSNAPELAVEMSRLLASPDARTSKWLWYFAEPRRHLHLSVAPLMSDVATGRVWVFHDVSELFDALHSVRKLENRLHHLLSEGDVIAFRLRRGGVFEWVSKSTVRMMGFDEHAYLGESATNFCHPDDQPLFHATVKRLRSTGEPQPIAIRVGDAHGRTRSLEGRVFLANDGSDSLEVIMSDVTSHVELGRLRATIASAASHELKTPLAFMSMALTLLDDGEMDPSSDAGREVVERMHAATNRLARMSDSFLNLQKLEIDRTSRMCDAVSVIACVETAVLNVSLERGVRVEIIDRTQAANRRIDADLVGHAVINLVDNAVRHAPDDTAIHVDVRVEHDTITISVRDHGGGVPPQSRQRIFEPFVRLDHDRRGSGLGLAIVDRVAKIHSGSVQVTDPDDGIGAEFTLVLTAMGDDT